MVAAAVIGAGVLAAGATVYASGQAANATTSATNASIQEQKDALAQQAAMSKPYRDLGTNNIQTYQSLLTGGGGPDASAKIQSTLESLPGYQFTRDQGIEAAKRANPNLSGNQVVAAEQYGSGLADQTYGERLSQLLQPIQLGQAAAAGQAANIGNAAGNISSSLINQGNTIAGIDANETAGLSRLAGNVGNQLITYRTLQGLNNPVGGGTGGTIPDVPSFTPDPSTFTYTGGGTPNFGP